MAQAMGIMGIRVTHPQELPGALKHAFAYKGPVLVDVVSARQELILPPKATLGEAKSFSLFMLKAVLDGRLDQLVDLTKVNLTW